MALCVLDTFVLYEGLVHGCHGNIHMVKKGGVREAKRVRGCFEYSKGVNIGEGGKEGKSGGEGRTERQTEIS